MRWGRAAGGQALKPRHDVVGNFEIGKHVLHVVAVLQRLEQLEQRLGGVAVDRRQGLGPPDELRRRGGAEALLERVAHAVQRVGGAGDHVLVGAALDIVGAGLDGRLEHRIGRRRGGGIGHLPDAVEQEADAVGFAEIAAGLGEGGADVAGGAVAVVGQRLDDDGDAAGAIALVAHLLVVLALAAAGAALDRALDRVLGHVGLARRDHRRAQPRIGVGVGQAAARRGGQFADELGEDLGALFVLRALAVHDVLELGMTSHVDR